ncbi:hypothetical protein CKA32_003959 [Geitlerinema sp. FC II]|nr:hypothetical protein CKA32_003959 [Geitlerinema sp. FC II]
MFARTLKKPVERLGRGGGVVASGRRFGDMGGTAIVLVFQLNGFFGSVESPSSSG